MEEVEIVNTLSLLVIGGSAGSLAVLLDVLPLVQLPPSKAIVIVVHRKNTPDSLLSELLASRSGLPVKEIGDKEPLRGGGLYLAPPDYHVLFETDQTLSLDVSEKINYSRPSIDVAFTSAADVYRERLSCLLLSGANADGVDGLRYVRSLGGMIAVQRPETAEAPYMPQQAVHHLPGIREISPIDMPAFINSL